MSSHFIVHSKSYKNNFGITNSHVSNKLFTLFDIKALDSKPQRVDAIFLDWSKAFGQITYSVLLKKLHHYGICGKTLSWINTFICVRKQRVMYSCMATEPETPHTVPWSSANNSFAPVSHCIVAESLTYEQCHSISLTLLVQPFSAIRYFFLSAWTTPTHTETYYTYNW